MRKKILIFVFVLVLISCVSSNPYVRSSPQFTNTISGSGYYGGVPTQFDKNICQEGQDFVLQVAPFGCSPTVVRSDLLEEQNVAVYCQLAATKINPVIEVDAIESVSFSGDYPPEVAGVGFHPAMAALGNKETRLNTPILNNIGYIVVVLKQQQNESSMPDVVRGNLTARIRYDIKHAFGLEPASFYLPVMSSDEWESKKTSYGFWNGQGFLRAETIYDDTARISVYHYDKRVSAVDLRVGGKSESIYFPGFDCLAGFELKLDKLEHPGKTALFEIDGSLVEVAINEKFLDNRCELKNIISQGIRQRVEISCRQDDGGVLSSRNIPLEILPKIDLKIGDEEKKNLEVGEKLFNDGEGKAVYLGYVGTKGSKTNSKDVYALLFQGKESVHGDKLSREIIQKVLSFNDRSMIQEDASGRGHLRQIISEASFNIEKNQNYFKSIFIDADIQFVNITKRKVFGSDIKVMRMSAPTDKNLLSEKISESTIILGELYNNAKQDYRNVIEMYSGVEKYNTPGQKLGEEALFNLINLADELEQKAEMWELCNEFKRNYYPQGDSSNKGKYNSLFKANGKCSNLFSLSSDTIKSTSVMINGQSKSINFLSINTPSANEYGAEIHVSSIGGGSNRINRNLLLRVGDVVYLNNGDYIVLDKIDENNAYFKSYIQLSDSSSIIEKSLGSDFKVQVGKTEFPVSKYSVTLNKINLEKRAKVSVIPAVDAKYSYANFSFAVGIEKRAIQLSPERVNRSIANLEKQIEDYNKISEKLETSIEALQGACLLTGATFTLLNFGKNFGGEGAARQEVMGEIWKPHCTLEIKEGKYTNLEACYIDKANEIDASVKERAKQMDATNRLLRGLQGVEGVSETGTFGKDVNTAKLKVELVPKVKESLEGSLALIYSGDIEEGITQDVFRKNYINETLAIEDLRDLYSHSESYLSSSEGVYKENSENQIKILVKRIIRENQNRVIIQEAKSNFLEAGYEVGILTDEKTITETFKNKYITKEKLKCFNRNGDCDIENLFSNGENGKEIPIRILADTSSQKNYLYILNPTSTMEYTSSRVYEVISVNKENGIITVNQQVTKRPITNVKFISSEKGSYNNFYSASEGDSKVVIRYFDTGVSNPLPAIVPFDEKEGWYAAMRSVISYNDVSSYDDSGRVSNFYLCNVGENGGEENMRSDDICMLIYLGVSGTYSNFPGLSSKETQILVDDAVNAIAQASRQASGTGRVTITRKSTGAKWTLDRGAPALNVPEMDCFNFMSPKQCHILFNVCDPVVCPSSRCDFGGAYPHRNVVQSGIIGSIALCLPNFIGFGGTNYIPICLTGVKAGLDGWISILEGHKRCLEENLKTGKMTGTCDYMYSIYACDFFWKQALPLAKIGIPKLIEVVTGQNNRGGGEYMNVQSAFDTAQKSMQYFMGYYQSESNRFLQVNSIGDFIGDEICKAYASANYPEGKLSDSLIGADSPAQFHGRFDSNIMTTATNPPTSHYKVFYHIFAGKNDGAYYRVYLKSSDRGGYYMDAGGVHNVDSGSIGIGESVSETKDFTAPAGYNELCINVNGQEECGFEGNQVSTSLAVDYMRDQFVDKQAREGSIRTEQECLSTSAGVHSLMALNPQAIAEDVVSQSIYETGIIRVCASENPGKGSDSNYGMENQKWVEVGRCSDAMRCWLDKDSVSGIIENVHLKEGFLEDTNTKVQETLKKAGEILSDDEYRELMEKLLNDKEEPKSSKNRIDEVNKVINKVYWDYQKGNLIFERARAWDDWAGDEAPAIKEKLIKDDDGDGKIIRTIVDQLKSENCKDLVIQCENNICSDDGLGLNTDRSVEGVEKAITNSGIDNRCVGYVGKVVEESKKINVDPLLVIALMAHESKGCNSSASSETKTYTLQDGASIGLMQISCKTWAGEHDLPEDLTECAEYLKKDPEKSIEIGLKILKTKKTERRIGGDTFVKACCLENKNIEFNGWLRALRGYNGWGCNEDYKNQDIFVLHILNNYKSLKNALGEEVEIPISLKPVVEDVIATPTTPTTLGEYKLQNPYNLSCNEYSAFNCGGITKEICNQIMRNDDSILGGDDLAQIKDCYGRSVLHYAGAFSKDQRYFIGIWNKGFNNLNIMDRFGNTPLHYTAYHSNKHVLSYYRARDTNSFKIENSFYGITPENIEKYIKDKKCSDCTTLPFNIGAFGCTEGRCRFIEHHNDIKCVFQEQNLLIYTSSICESLEEFIDDVERMRILSLNEIMNKYFEDRNVVKEFILNSDYKTKLGKELSEISKNNDQGSRPWTLKIVLENYFTINEPLIFNSGGLWIKGTQENKIILGSNVYFGSVGSDRNPVFNGYVFIENTEINSHLIPDGGYIILGEGVVVNAQGSVGRGMIGGTIIIKKGAEIKGEIGTAMRGGKIIIEDGAIIGESKVNQDAVERGFIEIRLLKEVGEDEMKITRVIFNSSGELIVNHNCDFITYGVYEKGGRFFGWGDQPLFSNFRSGVDSGEIIPFNGRHKSMFIPGKKYYAKIYCYQEIEAKTKQIGKPVESSEITFKP